MKVYEQNNLIVLESGGHKRKVPKGLLSYVENGDMFVIHSTHDYEVKYAKLRFDEYQNEAGVSYASAGDLEAALDDLIGAVRVDGAAIGFIDYNDTTGSISFQAETWTDVPNNGQGAFSNSTYKPTLINNVMDTSTGYLDFSELTLGSQLIVRNDFKVNPDTNNALLQARYVLGQGDGEYSLLFWSERLDGGSGIDYQRVPSFPIYMGDENTRGGAGKLQIKLSSTGTLTNAGSYINIQLK